MSGIEGKEDSLEEAMTRGVKRQHAVLEDRSISPPPLRRQKPATTTPVPSGSIIKQPFEVISWNVNGIGPFLNAQTPKITSFFCKTGPTVSKEDQEQYSLRNFLKRHKYPQMLCLQEVKINPKDEAKKKALERAANSDGSPSYTAHFSLPRDKYNAKGFGGKVHGVCTLIRDNVLQEQKVVTRDVDWDLEGRVLITECETLKLAIINGYWVNGTTNPYRDPNTGEITGTRHDWKRKFHEYMLEEVKNYEAKDWRVVLIGDMNIAREAIDGYPGIRLGHDHVKNRSDFNSKFFHDQNGMRGIDTFRHFYGGKRKYSYHGEKEEDWGRSCDRVDLGIVSRNLVEGRGGLLGADIWESVEERGHSDHVPIGIVLDLGHLSPASS